MVLEVQSMVSAHMRADHFPVIHSTLDPRALAGEIAQRHGLVGDVHCRLISRGSNDIYAVSNGQQRFALRVAKADFREPEDLLYELKFLAHLKRSGIPVSSPVRDRAGEPFLSLRAPEGVRHLTLFEWVEGRSCHPMTAEQARRAGAEVAGLHLAGRDFPGAHQRVFDTRRRLLGRRAPLDALLESKPADREAVRAAMDRCLEWIARASEAKLPRGMTHGDLQPANVMMDEAGTMTFIDFDDCAEDCLVRDISCFVWRNRFDRVDPGTDRSFIAGYEARRPLSAEEREAIPMLTLVRNLYILLAYAAIIDRVGPIPGFDSYQRFIDLLEVDTMLNFDVS